MAHQATAKCEFVYLIQNPVFRAAALHKTVKGEGFKKALPGGKLPGLPYSTSIKTVSLTQARAKTRMPSWTSRITSGIALKAA
jgi:hypothetical protein